MSYNKDMAQKIDYQALSAELEEILGRLQSGDLQIDEALKAHERGQKIIAQLQMYLKTAENSIKKLPLQ